MCATCGCSEEGAVRVHHHEHASGHDHTHEHAHTPAHAHGDTVRLEEAALGRNAGLAEQNGARVRGAAAPVLEINTGPACHLDAHMVGHALEALRPGERSSVIIENVGNLI